MVIKIRRHTRVLLTWTFTSCFVFMITFNFYVNVWHFESEVLSDNAAHTNSSYIVWKKHQAGHVPSDPPLPGVWPDLNHYDDDRILQQLNLTSSNTGGTLKTILLYSGFRGWDVKPGQQTFIDQKCPVNTCSLTDNRQHGATADAVLFRQNPAVPSFIRPPHQIWILFLLESPLFTPRFTRFSNQFNWTATYRRDSDIVTPYEKYVKHKQNSSLIQPPLPKNYAAGKTKKVAWFVSNCHASNARLEYAKELSKYIQVDVYGKCGTKRCPRSKTECFDMLDRDYKFYLSFENSNCRDYITEKFFVNGLQHDVIPIVMGAAPEDYRRSAPHYSYIHVDEYSSPQQLAEYLMDLDKDDAAYNEYFRWKHKGSFINTYFWCRVCAMLHDTSHPVQKYGDLEEWWRGKNVCIGKDRWGQHPRLEPFISDYYKNRGV